MRTREGLSDGPGAGRVRVKLCGMTRAEDARAAAALGADAVGLVFHPPSPRAVDAEQAAAVLEALPPFVARVGVFVNPEPDALRAVLGRVALDVIQFHGDEPPELCAAAGPPWIKAVAMRGREDAEDAARRYAGAAALLLDTHSVERRGGTGQTFDWSLVPRDLGLPVLLAGGLDPANVAAAVRAVRPYAVDAASGVESAPGIKDHGKMQAFIREVTRGQAA
jgi:phosphoribosylanthranilate isomerase